MRAFIYIDCDNSAFFLQHDDGSEESARGFELAAILRDLADELASEDDTPRIKVLKDTNGNAVGTFSLVND